MNKWMTESNLNAGAAEIGHNYFYVSTFFSSPFKAAIYVDTYK